MENVLVNDSELIDYRKSFIRKTYGFLLLAILAFAGLEYIFLVTGISYKLLMFVAQTNWLLILGGFILLSWLAQRFAQASSFLTQGLGLSVYVLAEAIIFAPLIFIAISYGNEDGNILLHAAVLTITMFLALTGIAFTSNKDFSFLGNFLKMVGMLVLGLIVSGVLFGFSLGVVFMSGMVLFASTAILYDTSNVIRKYRDDQYILAALALFSSVALLFWYVLQLFSRRN